MDPDFDADSVNGVENRVITQKFADIQAEIDGKQPTGDYAYKSEIPDVSVYETTVHASDTYQPKGEYATKTELNTGLSGKQDAGNYATTQQLEEGLATKQPAGEYQPKGDYATKEYVNGKVSSVYRVMGSCTPAELVNKPRDTGDVWNLTAESDYGPSGTNVVYDGTKWDALGGVYDLSGYETIASCNSKLAGKMDLDDLPDWVVGNVTLTNPSATDIVVKIARKKRDTGVDSNTTYTLTSATKSKAGLMSAEQVQTLNGKASQSDLDALASRVQALENIPNANGVSF